MIFQQDRAQTQFRDEVTCYLVEGLSNRWIGCGGLKELPPRSPGLTPWNFLLLRSVNDSVNWSLHEFKTWVRLA
jgi:hypothetical protein